MPLLADPSDPATAILDELRRTEFSRLDIGGHVYLDYTGGGLYAETQLREHFELLSGGVFGNPHSLNPTSAVSTELLQCARARVLEFFRASPAEYVAIFTPNATGALRLVGEAYPFRSWSSRGSRRASGHVVIQPTFVNLPLVRTTTRPWQLGFESLIFVNLSLLPFSLNL